jgi:hypothetical protein
MPSEIMDLPMTACSYYYVQSARKNGVKNIGRLPDEEILKQQDVRSCEIIADYFVKKGILKPEERDDFFKEISTAPSDYK